MYATLFTPLAEKCACTKSCLYGFNLYWHIIHATRLAIGWFFVRCECDSAGSLASIDSYTNYSHMDSHYAAPERAVSFPKPFNTRLWLLWLLWLLWFVWFVELRPLYAYKKLWYTTSVVKSQVKTIFHFNAIVACR